MSIPESQFSEDKQSLSELQAIVETVAAFATCEGGTIRVGIKPNGEWIGVEIGRTTLEDLARDIKLNTDPPQFPSIIVEGEEKSAVIYIQVTASLVKPVFAYGRPYLRVGRTNQRLSREEVKRLLQQTEGRTWDTLPCAGSTPDQIDGDAIRDFLHRARQDTSAAPMTVLENLSLPTIHGEVCNGAVLLFAANTQRFFRSLSGLISSNGLVSVAPRVTSWYLCSKGRVSSGMRGDNAESAGWVRDYMRFSSQIETSSAGLVRD